MDLDLKGRIAVVTGASRGIGLAITASLLREGARVAAVSRTSSPALAALGGTNLIHVPADLMRPEAPEQAIHAAVERFGSLDILVNNAGGPPPGVPLPRTSFLDATDDAWAKVFTLNLFSAVRCIRAGIPHLLAKGGGTIINVTSTLAHQPSPTTVDYGAAKAALLNLSKAVAEEFGPRGIRVNTVSPGATHTHWWTKENGAAERIAGTIGVTSAEVLASLAPAMMNMLTGRLVDPREVADMVTLLASPRSASTIGAEFIIDGGGLKSL